MSPYDLSRIQAATGISTIDFHQSLGSTNDRAIEILKSPGPIEFWNAGSPGQAPPSPVCFEAGPFSDSNQTSSGKPGLPLLVLTDRQTHGRGQHHRPWTAGAGAITFSLCRDSQGVPWPVAGTVSLGWAVCCAIEGLTGRQLPELGLKWPNDIFWGSCKLGGILVESILPNPASNWSDVDAPVWVLGIGLNVNNPIRSADLMTNSLDQSSQPPLKKLTTPTSLIQTLGQPLDQTALLIELLQQIELTFRRLSSDPGELIGEVYQRMILRERLISVQLGDRKIIQGKVTGLGPAGELLLSSDGKTHSINSGQIIDW